MSPSQAMQLIRDLHDVVWSAGDLSAVDRLIAPNYVIHSDPGDQWEGQTLDRAAYRQRVLFSRTAFPDLVFTIHDLLASEHRVAVRWSAEGTQRGDLPGLPATGMRLSFAGQTIYDLENGQIAGHWQVVDRLGFIQKVRAGDRSPRGDSGLRRVQGTRRVDDPGGGKAMPTVTLVPEDSTDPIVAEVFADIKATKKIDFVPAIWRALATHPPHLQLCWTRLKAIMQPGKVDLLTKEIVALAVSVTNSCRYCVNSHTAAAQKLGLDDEMLGEVLAVVGLFNQMNKLADAYQVEPDVLPAAARK